MCVCVCECPRLCFCLCTYLCWMSVQSPTKKNNSWCTLTVFLAFSPAPSTGLEVYPPGQFQYGGWIASGRPHAQLHAPLGVKLAIKQSLWRTDYLSKDIYNTKTELDTLAPDNVLPSALWNDAHFLPCVGISAIIVSVWLHLLDSNHLPPTWIYFSSDLDI